MVSGSNVSRNTILHRSRILVRKESACGRGMDWKFFFFLNDSHRSTVPHASFNFKITTLWFHDFENYVGGNKCRQGSTLFETQQRFFCILFCSSLALSIIGKGS